MSEDVSQADHNADRMRRASSWLDKSRKVETSHERFIFLWIAFNAAYGAELVDVGADSEFISEAKRFQKFLREIVKRDEKNRIDKIIWETYSGPIRLLLANQYVFRPYWEFVQGTKSDTEWRDEFKRYNRRVNNALARTNIHTILVEIFYRLYTLRNQVFHGGTTFATGMGKAQLRVGSQIMKSLIPVILKIMKADIANNPNSEVWGKVAFPRINYNQDD